MLTLILTLLAAWTLWSLTTLYRNYRLAQTIRLPIIIEPFSNLSLQWFITDALTRQIPLLRPIRNVLVRRFLPFSYFGWQFDLGHDVHAKYGPAFTHVSPGSISISIGDAAAAYDVMSRRKDFIKPHFMYKHLNTFGPNVNTVEGEVWQRHRRLTGPSFNEKVSCSVCEVTRLKAKDMLDRWVKTGLTGVSTTVGDTADLASHVLTIVGFGQSTDNKSLDRHGHENSFHLNIHIILQGFIFITILPARILSWRWMPLRLRRLGQASIRFKEYVVSFLEDRRMQNIGENELSNDLLSQLARAADAEKGDAKGLGMTDEEIYGNMFIFTLAGHETTANTIATAIVYLARYPRYQSWVREEIRYVMKDGQGGPTDYETYFPQLKRCLAIMYETLRVHGSIVFIPRSTHFRPEKLTVNGKEHIIPPNTLIWVNNQATQLDPANWEEDGESWKPDRWIERDDGAEGLKGEKLKQSVNGSFMPWAEGPRNCLGKKFSQVEFVAALVTMFRNYEVKPVLGTE